MKKKALKKIISSRLKKMQKHCNNIKKHFRDEDIHKFRVEVKKFRALLRMIALGLNKPEDLKLPKKLKQINGTAGVIRDIRLHLQRIDAAIPEKADQPDSYLHLLKEKMAKSQKQLVELLSKYPIPSFEKTVVDALPERLPVETIDRFVQQQIRNITLLILGKHQEDNDIHSIRKHLKDLLYDVKIFQEDAKNVVDKPLIEAGKLKQVDELAVRLGEFNDICFAILFLQPDYLSKVDEHEKEQLLRVQEKWLQEKEMLKQAALKNLSSFYPAFVSSL